MCFLKRQTCCCLCWNVNWGLSGERGLSGGEYASARLSLRRRGLTQVSRRREFEVRGVESRAAELRDDTKNVVYIFDNREIASRVAIQSRD